MKLLGYVVECDGLGTGEFVGDGGDYFFGTDQLPVGRMVLVSTMSMTVR
jgi:hypothetical protein